MCKKTDSPPRFLVWSKETDIINGKGGPRREIVIETPLALELNIGDRVILTGFGTKKELKAVVKDKTEKRIVVALKDNKNHAKKNHAK